jgi:uncharacterized protein (DUF885 family)
MSIKIDDPNNPGNEIEVFLPDEVSAQVTEKETALAEARAEVEKYKAVSAEKTENFKKLNEMSEQEKAKYSANEIENMKRVEMAEAKAKALEDKINEDTTKRIESDKAKALAKYHGGDATLKEALEKNFTMIALDGNDTETIEERARLAASMEAGKTGKFNPLMSSMNGGAPTPPKNTKTEEFMKTEKAKAALAAMGD